MLDETRNQLQMSKNQHLRQIELMESEELNAQKKVRNEMIQMEDVLAQIRKEYEMLRIEFEQNMAANEQTAPINREMRHLITSLQNHNGQLKGEVQRYKRKYKDAASEMAKIRKDLEEATAKINGSQNSRNSQENFDMKQEIGNHGIKEELSSENLHLMKEENSGLLKKELDDNDDDSESKEGIKKENLGSSVRQEKNSNLANDKKDGTPGTVKNEKEMKDAQKVKELKIVESDLVRELKAQLK